METTMKESLFHVYKTGHTTVIGFEGRHLNKPECARDIRDQLLQLVSRDDCKVLVADMMDVSVVSSWILGVLAAVRSRGIDVELYHPSAEIKEILDVTHLDQFLHIRDSIA